MPKMTMVQAINLAATIFQEARSRGYKKMNLLDIGGGFPAPYDDSVKPFRDLARKINAELDRLELLRVRHSRKTNPTING